MSRQRRWRRTKGPETRRQETKLREQKGGENSTAGYREKGEEERKRRRGGERGEDEGRQKRDERRREQKNGRQDQSSRGLNPLFFVGPFRFVFLISRMSDGVLRSSEETLARTVAYLRRKAIGSFPNEPHLNVDLVGQYFQILSLDQEKPHSVFTNVSDLTSVSFILGTSLEESYELILRWMQECDSYLSATCSDFHILQFRALMQRRVRTASFIPFLLVQLLTGRRIVFINPLAKPNHFSCPLDFQNQWQENEEQFQRLTLPSPPRPASDAPLRVGIVLGYFFVLDEITSHWEYDEGRLHSVLSIEQRGSLHLRDNLHWPTFTDAPEDDQKV